LELLDHLGRAALGKAAAAQERPALGVAQQHRAFALLAGDVSLDGCGLGRLELATLIDADDQRARRLTLFILDAVPRAAEEFPDPPAALAHLAAADRAVVLRPLAHLRLALLINRLGVIALAVLAGEEKAVLADAVEHVLTALFALVRGWRSAGMLDL